MLKRSRVIGVVCSAAEEKVVHFDYDFQVGPPPPKTTEFPSTQMCSTGDRRKLEIEKQRAVLSTNQFPQKFSSTSAASIEAIL